MQKITPFLWFDNQAEEAAKFYMSLFKNSKIGDITRSSTKESGRPVGSVLVVDFQLEGQEFAAINGGPAFKFTEAVSFVVNCETQEEVDYFWNNLVEGGQESQCGWLKDKFGLSWQITPARIGDLIKHPKAMQAMMGMKKLDIAELERAGKS